VIQALKHITITNHGVFWMAILGAIALQICGHILRARRTKLIIDQAALSSDRFQFGALSIGYLFNAFLPFRFGEVVRSLLVAKRLRISFLYTVTAVMVERATDVLLLGALVVVGALLIGGVFAIQVILLATGAMVLAVCLLVGIWLLIKEDHRLLSLAWKMTNWFNPSLRNSLRFKVWSLIFGLQRFFRNKQLTGKYALYTITSWMLYGSSAAVLAAVTLGKLTLIERFISAVAPYVVSIPTWSILRPDEYSQFVTLLPGHSQIALVNFGLLSWGVLVFPMAIIGFVVLIGLRIMPSRERTNQESLAFVNKLSRYDDISQAFPGFLDSYFAGNELAMLLHRLEISGDMRLVRYFKGGSDAITVLVLNEDQLYVKKIIPKRYKSRLKAQYDWLQQHSKMKYLVSVLGEHDMDDFYSIDLAYDPKYIPYFEYLHHSSKQQAIAVLDAVWGSLYKTLHKDAASIAYKPQQRNKFIEKHIWGCVAQATNIHAGLKDVLQYKKITINGVEYDNLNVIMNKIKRHKQAWRDIATYRESGFVHGDPLVDNILVASDNGKPLIIDPAPDGNIINGAVFDMGKLLQSFYCGYEFLFRDEDTVELSPEMAIYYRDQRSEQYLKICQYIREDLARQYLSEEEHRALLFHAGTLLIRRLKHQVRSYPQNSLKIYAVGVKTLNDFYAQYEKP